MHGMNRNDRETMSKVIDFSQKLYVLVEQSDIGMDHIVQQMSTLICAICIESNISKEDVLSAIAKTYEMVNVEKDNNEQSEDKKPSIVIAKN